VVFSSPNTKSWLLHVLLLFWSSKELFIPEDSWIFNFSIRVAGGWYYLALVLSPQSGTEATGSKNVQGCYTSRSYCIGGRGKNAQIYVIEQAKKMSSTK
jgi:hypothetical protein